MIDKDKFIKWLEESQREPSLTTEWNGKIVRGNYFESDEWKEILMSTASVEELIHRCFARIQYLQMHSMMLPGGISFYNTAHRTRRPLLDRNQNAEPLAEDDVRYALRRHPEWMQCDVSGAIAALGIPGRRSRITLNLRDGLFAWSGSAWLNYVEMFKDQPCPNVNLDITNPPEWVFKDAQIDPASGLIRDDVFRASIIDLLEGGNGDSFYVCGFGEIDRGLDVEGTFDFVPSTIGQEQTILNATWFRSPSGEEINATRREVYMKPDGTWETKTEQLPEWVRYYESMWHVEELDYRFMDEAFNSFQWEEAYTNYLDDPYSGLVNYSFDSPKTTRVPQPRTYIRTVRPMSPSTRGSPYSSPNGGTAGRGLSFLGMIQLLAFVESSFYTGLGTSTQTAVGQMTAVRTRTKTQNIKCAEVIGTLMEEFLLTHRIADYVQNYALDPGDKKPRIRTKRKSRGNDK
ncbi:MAG: hypothetical protein R3F13_13945 [Prosthecobacter sp.]